MPIVVNGTTIPENVANALNVNGTNITSVVCNGTTVWTQSLFNALWSGSSTYSSAGWTTGLQTSGSSYRMISDYVSGTAFDIMGAWQTVNTNGVFSGISIANVAGIDGTTLMIRAVMPYPSNTYGTWITFDINTKSFSGVSYASYMDGEGQEICKFDTSGGLLRFSFGFVNYSTSGFFGSYISLT